MSTETELILGVAALDVAVKAEFVESAAGEGYGVVLRVRNFGAEPAGPFAVVARTNERSGLGSHRVRTVTHGVTSLEPGSSVLIRSVRVARPCPVTVRGALARMS